MLAAYTTLPVIGLPIKSSTMDGLEKLHEIGVDGVIIGRALYNGALDLAEVMERFAK